MGKIYETINAINSAKEINGEDLGELSEPCIYYVEDSIRGRHNPKEVIIPISGMDTLKSNIFKNNIHVAKVKIPDEIKFIEPSAFYGCTNLRSIELPKDLKVIENNTFYNCSKLDEVKLPEGLKEIKENAFYSCESLEKIEIPDSVDVIGETAFSYNYYLKSVKLPKGLEKIGNQVFSGCNNLTDIKIPKTVTEIGRYAFSNCKKLEHIELPEGLETICDGAFEECHSIKNIKLPSTLKQIGESSFQYCEGLEDISFPNGIKRIEPRAFRGCSSLTKIVFPNSLFEINAYAFYGCGNLVSIKFSNNLQCIDARAFANCERLEEINLPDGLIEIGKEAFYGCESLKKVRIPYGVKRIGEDIFNSCYELESVFYPDSIERYTALDKRNFMYFNKEENGFSFSNKRQENSIYADSFTIDPILLSKNWQYREILFREQKKEFQCDFYNVFLKELPIEKQNEFIESHNFTFLKQFDIDMSYYERHSFYAMMYNLGGFKRPFKQDGKEYNLSQMVSEFLLSKIRQNVYSISEISNAFSKINNEGIKLEFNEFFMKNFDMLMFIESGNEGFISRCYNEFEEVQKTNTNNHGSQRQLKATVEKFINYFDENKFRGITPETKEIANTIAPYFDDQRLFDEAVKIDKERKESGVPNHILGKPLSEKDMFAKIDELTGEIKYMQGEFLGTMAKIADEEFTFEWLAKNDPQNFILGKLCTCCAHIDGAGYGIMRASIISPNVQNLVIRNKKGEIIAKSTLYINTEQGYGVFNNVEVNDYVSDRKKNLIMEKYYFGVKAFAEEYNRLHPDKPLKQINVGMNLNDLEEEITPFFKKSKILPAIKYGKFCEGGEGYDGDSEEEQYTIWSNGGSQSQMGE